LPLDRPLRIRIAYAGFEPHEADVTLTADRARDRILAHLSPAVLTLQLTIDPPDAALWVDGKYVSGRTLTGLTVAQDHKIAVSAPGRVGKILIFRAEQGGEKRLQLKLDPARSIR
jgi:hypothetical protein